MLVPDVIPCRLRDAVRRIVQDHEIAEWVDLDPAALRGGAPAGLIRERLRLEPSIVSAVDVARSAAFIGYLVWVDGIPPGDWSRWSVFLEEYANASRSRGEHERSIFCVQAPPAVAGSLPRQDVALGIELWRDVVTQLDLFLFSLQLSSLQTIGERPLLQRLHAALVSELAVFDGILAARLAERTTAELLDPEALLEDYAASRGWHGAAWGQGWASGAEAIVDGQPIPHVCADLVNRREARAIEQRLWRAQVSILFPAIEEQRIRLLRRYGAFVRLPWRTAFGEIHDVHDLELGHLLKQLHGRHGVRSEHARLLECLAKARNALAHIELVDFESIKTIAATGLPPP
ncbi:hypothetical protein [Sorangium sp. So ce426]|uniref:hypothetical protein n=1 Tax=Sorangium sp. So ce426 TaxID=3133312 RepID=UPI003F5BB2B3